ncbi:MAG TPA: carotenoid 1,2-hydratase, partial [Steroidobacteraceae bacterium]|nr:carotenoid 1,2-hydratase [Steroidobacteraceae bacterium]
MSVPQPARPARLAGPATRAWLVLLGALAACGCLAAAAEPPASAPIGQTLSQSSSAPVLAGVPLQFPRDYGSHPQFGIEWWYLTGWLTTAQHQPLGFQITFFRVRTGLDEANPSAFAARQLLIAHAAISDPAHGRLWQDQRIRRAGLGLAQADGGDTHVWMDDWSLQRHDGSGPGGVYVAQVNADDFGFDLTATADSPPMLNGDAGFSQKAPQTRSASYYYSQPQLRVRGSVTRDGRREPVTGQAWLDHEWASQYLDPAAAGWDWVGLNLDDGSAIMAFEIRDRHGQAYWAAGTLRDARGRSQVFGPGDIAFTPTRRWRSPRTGVIYPVAEQLRIGTRVWQLQPLLDDQEFDATLTSGAIYWEGAVTAASSTGAGTGAGAGAGADAKPGVKAVAAPL